MKRILLATVGLAVLLALGATAFAEPFDYPPEDNAPGWAWGFPYQRNILWTFDTDPRDDTSPGNGADYEGWLDPLLWDSDYVELNPSPPVGHLDSYGALTGVVGIFNGTNDPMSGEIRFHIDNTLWPIDYKNMWLEYEYVASTGVAIELAMTPGPGDPLAYTVLDWMPDPRELDPASHLMQQNAWFRIEPNPFWEDIVISLTVPGGGYAFIDRMHIATECIPEPASLTLFGLGLAGLVFCGYRRTRRG